MTKGYDNGLLFEQLSFQMPPGAILGVIGPNGAGKTTMLRLITGQERPDAGTIKIGQTVKLGYVDQSRDTLDGEKSVWEEITGGEETIVLGERKMNSRAYVNGFNFVGSDQQKKVGALSGGERNRVHLAKVLKEGANVLLLDEPTNDLDVNTLRRTRGGARRVRRQRSGRQPRPLVSGSHLHAHPGVRRTGAWSGRWVTAPITRKHGASASGVAADTPHRLVHRRLVR